MTTGETAKSATDTPVPVPVPEDFPVTWQSPEDEAKFWNHDKMHFPDPATPLMDAFVECFNTGFSRAAASYDLPMRMAYGRFNTYFYSAVSLNIDPANIEAEAASAQQKIAGAMGRLQELWDNELLPEVKEHLVWWEAFDLEGASTDELLAHVGETLERLTRLWDIHFVVAFPFIGAPSLFDDFYADVFGREKTLDAYGLLQGFGNRTVDGGHALWALSRKAIASPPVREAIESNEAAAVPAALEQSDEGRAFLLDLDAYLEEFGQRSNVFTELGSLHWMEDPSTAIQNMKNYMAQEDRDLGGELAALAEEREELIAKAREKLAGYPQAARDGFEFLLKAAQAATRIQEDHNYWIDQRATYKVRMVLLEFGRRLVAGNAIDEANDVFYLTLEEIREQITADAPADQRAVVAGRKADMNHFREINPPPALGTPPAEAPPENPLSRAFGRFNGAPPVQSDESGVINGNAGARGKVTGVAKVVLSLADAAKLKPGDVLVAPATMPAWTPLFASISAVVTDAGGVLSHAAIVAREYDIPAVLGTHTATSTIKDGQTIEVDGDEGVVRIVS